MNTTAKDTRRQMASAYIDQQSLLPIVEKYGLIPQFETWVSVQYIDGKPLTYPDCGVRFYIKNSDICVGMIHVGTGGNKLLCSQKVKVAGGLSRYSLFPHQMVVCHTELEFDEKVGKLIS